MIENAAHLAMLACLAGAGLLIWFLLRPSPPCEGPAHLDEAEAIAKAAPPVSFPPHPMFRSYDGAARLQRASQAATQYLMKQAGSVEATGTAKNGYRDYGIRPTAPLDAGELTKAIITAWLGDEEPMVNVPIIKLTDIKMDGEKIAAAREARELIERDHEAEKVIGRDFSRRARLAAVNTERAAMGLPPLAAGGFVERAKPYVVGEQPIEARRPSDRKLDPDA